MFKIVRIPSRLYNFFSSLTLEFRWEHEAYFMQLVLAMAFGWGRRTVSNLYRHLDATFQRPQFNKFLNLGRYPWPELLMKLAAWLILRVKSKAGGTLYLILDDSKQRKRGKKMDAVSYVRDCVSGKTMPGHMYVTAAVKVWHFLIPVGIRLYVKKELCNEVGVKFRKTTQLAADLIRAFDPPKGLKVVVLFDSFYLCPAVKWACHFKKFRFASTLTDNRNLNKQGRKLKTGQYKKNAYRQGEKHSVEVVKKDGSAVCYHYVDAGWMQVGKLGKLHVVFSRKKGKKVLGIVTNDPHMTGAQIITAYSERWWIEVFFKDAKQLLGLGQYQNRSYTAAVTHLHLVCFAYALLTHLRIEKAHGAKGKKQNQAAKMSTMETQNELRRIVWQDLVDHLEKQPSGNSVVKELERLLVA